MDDIQQRPIDLEPSWLEHLRPCFASVQMERLRRFLLAQKEQGKIIAPSARQIFRAFKLTPIDKVKAVIVGQDPYHGSNQANGLCFSVNDGIAIPPSLQNIFKELCGNDTARRSKSGDLQSWASQGVLLLNSILTVELHRPASHANQGWEWFTDQVINCINQQCSRVAFLLWGSYAQRKGQQIDRQRHLVLSASHPSPLSAHRGFLGCRHFSQANDYITANGMEAINWHSVLE